MECKVITSSSDETIESLINDFLTMCIKKSWTVKNIVYSTPVINENLIVHSVIIFYGL